MNSSANLVERPCPSCGAAVRLAPEDLVVDMHVRCLHCNAEAQVAEEWDPRLGQNHWVLDDTDEELPSERI